MSAVSVITPFHNTARHLPECIESVLAQSHGDFEYLLVDNCSTDGGDDIAERYAQRDARIRFIRTQPLLPQVPNYNRALTYIAPASRWMKLVQPDDTLFPRCLEDMLKVADAHATIGVVSAYRLHGTGVQPPVGPPHTQSFMTGRDACRMMLIDDIFLFGSPTTVMIRADIVRRRLPFYTEGRFFEDAEVIYEILRDVDFGFVHQVLTFSRVEQDSTWGRMRAYHPRVLSRLIQLKRYGAEYLTREENRRLVAAQERKYRRLLARELLAGRGSEFWKFHRQGLAEIGERLNRSALAGAAALLLLELLLSPTRVGKALLRCARRRRPPVQ